MKKRFVWLAPLLMAGPTVGLGLVAGLPTPSPAAQGGAKPVAPKTRAKAQPTTATKVPPETQVPPAPAAPKSPALVALPETKTTLRTVSPAALDYANDVAPIVARLGCAGADCHGAANGKGGLRLSLFGGEPRLDYEALTRAANGRRIDLVEPAKSLVLRKISGAVPHGGKKLAGPETPAYTKIAAWIKQGAVWSSPGRPRLVSIKLTPADATLAVGGSARLTVVAAYSDGQARDVTRDALLRANTRDVVQIARDGKLTAKAIGETAVVASYLRQFAMGRVVVPQKLPAAFPTVPAANPIDTLNWAHLKHLGIPPSDLCSDQVFVRRVYLDTIGLLPTIAEARSFLEDTKPDKRARLIDALLVRPEFADRWTHKWCDLLRVKSEYPVRLWPKAVQAYHRWVRESIAQNKPYDRFVTELLTATGTNFRDGAANYYRAVPSRDPQTFGETSALLFMGARIGCARCHVDPNTAWTPDDNAGIGAAFARVAYKPTQEWKEEVVYCNPDATFRSPRTSQVVTARFPDGTTLKADDPADPRAAFAKWLTTPGNPWFARSIANRVWYWLFDRGIVEEPDDLRPTNPPSNPELLTYLATELEKQHYDLRWLYRQILNSRTYQLSSTTTRWNVCDNSGHSHHILRRLEAEQTLDAIGQVTGAYEGYYTWIPEPYMHLPPDTRAQEVADGSIETPFLDLFGRSPRDAPFESGRCARPSMGQAMTLANSWSVDNKVINGTRMRRLLAPERSDAQVVEELYLSALSRYPTPQEKETVLAYLAKDPKARPKAIQDTMWALLNSKEFLYSR